MSVHVGGRGSVESKRGVSLRRCWQPTITFSPRSREVLHRVGEETAIEAGTGSVVGPSSLSSTCLPVDSDVRRALTGVNALRTTPPLAVGPETTNVHTTTTFARRIGAASVTQSSSYGLIATSKSPLRYFGTTPPWYEAHLQIRSKPPSQTVLAHAKRRADGASVRLASKYPS